MSGDPIWRKSSASREYGNCVEVAALSGDLIGVRDSKDPHGPVLLFPRPAWQACMDYLTDRP